MKYMLGCHIVTMWYAMQTKNNLIPISQWQQAKYQKLYLTYFSKKQPESLPIKQQFFFVQN